MRAGWETDEWSSQASSQRQAVSRFVGLMITAAVRGNGPYSAGGHLISKHQLGGLA